MVDKIDHHFVTPFNLRVFPCSVNANQRCTYRDSVTKKRIKRTEKDVR